MVSITESGVNFGDFSEEDLYKIEHSQGHLSLGEGFKMVEFTYLKNQKMFMVEAKSSIPNPRNTSDYENYWNEIFEKFENALPLQMMGCLKQNSIVEQELPSNHKLIDWQKATIQLRLIIPKVPNQHLPQITDKFRQRLHKIKKLGDGDVVLASKREASAEARKQESSTVAEEFKEKYYEDIGGVYMMLIGILMKLNMEKDDIKNMQNRGTTYAQNNYIGKTE